MKGSTVIQGSLPISCLLVRGFSALSTFAILLTGSSATAICKASIEPNRMTAKVCLGVSPNKVYWGNVLELQDTMKYLLDSDYVQTTPEGCEAFGKAMFNICRPRAPLFSSFVSADGSVRQNFRTAAVDDRILRVPNSSDVGLLSSAAPTRCSDPDLVAFTLTPSCGMVHKCLFSPPDGQIKSFRFFGYCDDQASQVAIRYDLAYMNKASAALGEGSRLCADGSSVCVPPDVPLLQQNSASLKKILRDKARIQNAVDVGFCAPTALSMLTAGLKNGASSGYFGGGVELGGSYTDPYDNVRSNNWAHLTLRMGQAVGTDWWAGGTGGAASSYRAARALKLGRAAGSIALAGGFSVGQISDFINRRSGLITLNTALSSATSDSYVAYESMLYGHSLTVAGHMGGRLRILDPWGRTYLVDMQTKIRDSTFIVATPLLFNYAVDGSNTVFQLVTTIPGRCDVNPGAVWEDPHTNFCIPPQVYGRENIRVSGGVVSYPGTATRPCLRLNNAPPMTCSPPQTTTDTLTVGGVPQVGKPIPMHLSSWNTIANWVRVGALRAVRNTGSAGPHLIHVEGDQGYVYAGPENEVEVAAGQELAAYVPSAGFFYEAARERTISNALDVGGQRARGIFAAINGRLPSEAEMGGAFGLSDSRLRGAIATDVIRPKAGEISLFYDPRPVEPPQIKYAKVAYEQTVAPPAPAADVTELLTANDFSHQSFELASAESPWLRQLAQDLFMPSAATRSLPVKGRLFRQARFIKFCSAREPTDDCTFRDQTLELKISATAFRSETPLRARVIANVLGSRGAVLLTASKEVLAYPEVDFRSTLPLVVKLPLNLGKDASPANVSWEFQLLDDGIYRVTGARLDITYPKINLIANGSMNEPARNPDYGYPRVGGYDPSQEFVKESVAGWGGMGHPALQVKRDGYNMDWAIGRADPYLSVACTTGGNPNTSSGQVNDCFGARNAATYWAPLPKWAGKCPSKAIILRGRKSGSELAGPGSGVEFRVTRYVKGPSSTRQLLNRTTFFGRHTWPAPNHAPYRDCSHAEAMQFDRDWYVATYPEIMDPVKFPYANKVDWPQRHFDQHSSTYNPNRCFDTHYYAAKNPSWKSEAVSPWAHYRANGSSYEPPETISFERPSRFALRGYLTHDPKATHFQFEISLVGKSNFPYKFDDLELDLPCSHKIIADHEVKERWAAEGVDHPPALSWSWATYEKQQLFDNYPHMDRIAVDPFNPFTKPPLEWKRVELRHGLELSDYIASNAAIIQLTEPIANPPSCGVYRVRAEVQAALAGASAGSYVRPWSVVYPFRERYFSIGPSSSPSFQSAELTFSPEFIDEDGRKIRLAGGAPLYRPSSRRQQAVPVDFTLAPSTYRFTADMSRPPPVPLPSGEPPPPADVPKKPPFERILFRLNAAGASVILDRASMKLECTGI